MQAGFIGLGTMGASMAANLQKGLKARGDTLVVHDVRREAGRRHVQDGAIWADSPQAVAEQSEVIFTSLPGPPEFEAVAAGLLAGIKKGTAYFDLTTNSPTVVRKAHDEFAAKGAHLFDAPVSGGPRGAASGKLAIWCGGDEAVFEHVEAGARHDRRRGDAISDRSVPGRWRNWCTTALATSPRRRRRKCSAWA